jgi:hypothetical protein
MSEFRLSAASHRICFAGDALMLPEWLECLICAGVIVCAPSDAGMFLDDLGHFNS